MDQYVVVVETNYKSTSANYRIKHTDPMPHNEASAQFNALRAGTDEMLIAIDGAIVVDVSDTQFLRLHKKLVATVMDRVTIGRATTQQA